MLHSVHCRIDVKSNEEYKLLCYDLMDERYYFVDKELMDERYSVRSAEATITVKRYVPYRAYIFPDNTTYVIIGFKEHRDALEWSRKHAHESRNIPKYYDVTNLSIPFTNKNQAIDAQLHIRKRKKKTTHRQGWMTPECLGGDYAQSWPHGEDDLEFRI